MSHHYSGPNIGFPRGDARLDFTDLYAFPKPGDPSKSILIMDVHPSFGANPPGPTTAEPFAPEALYELKIDTNGDAVADIAYRVRFASSADGSQTATVRRVEGAQAAETLLPDMLSYDPTRPASFPGNGRTLTDDAADAFLAVLTNGKVTADKVGPHIDLLAEFPYVGPPHDISVPRYATMPIATEPR